MRQQQSTLLESMSVMSATTDLADLVLDESVWAPRSRSNSKTKFELLLERPQYVRKTSMTGAVPGVGECNICMELVPCVKVLDCGHSLCVHCANRIVHAQVSTSQFIVCPECRQQTDSTKGVQYLPARYFGKIKCDTCLSQKDTEDIWWCAECVQSLCSKCSIKDHSKKNHPISEWNKLDAVKYSVHYIEGIRSQRQLSGGAEHNRLAIKTFVDAVEMALQKRMTLQPELDQLKCALVDRYGRKFSPSASPYYSRSQSCNNVATAAGQSGGKSDTDKLEATRNTLSADSAPKVLAKVLQLAGADILESMVPSAVNQAYQVYFDITPEEVAQFLMTKVTYIPLEDGEEHREMINSLDISPQLSSPNYSPSQEQSSSEIEEEITFPKPKSNGPFMQADISSNGVVALRTETEIVLCNTQTGASHTHTAQINQAYKSICFNHRTNELYVAMQSIAKKHEWFLEGWNINQLPYTTVFSTELDVDPEDHVMELCLYIDHVNNVVYEMRNCAMGLAEIWRANLTEKKSKIVLKETTIMQRPNSRYIALQCVESDTKSKEKFFIAFEANSKSLQRLVCRQNKCEVLAKILCTPDILPFCVDHRGFLWAYDITMMQLCVSQGTAANKKPVTFKRACGYTKHRLDGLSHSGVDTRIHGICVGKENVVIVVFKVI